jgi:hypothetical protein
MRILTMAALVAAGCAPVPPAEAGAGRNCDSAKAQKLIGRARSAKLGREALRLSGARNLRWIAPGTMVTMDYREDRLNLRLNPAGKVTVINCG